MFYQEIYQIVLIYFRSDLGNLGLIRQLQRGCRISQIYEEFQPLKSLTDFLKITFYQF